MPEGSASSPRAVLAINARDLRRRHLPRPHNRTNCSSDNAEQLNPARNSTNFIPYQTKIPLDHLPNLCY